MREGRDGGALSVWQLTITFSVQECQLSLAALNIPEDRHLAISMRLPERCGYGLPGSVTQAIFFFKQLSQVSAALARTHLVLR